MSLYDWPQFREAKKVELFSLIVKNNVSKKVNLEDIPAEARPKIHNLMILLKRKRIQHMEIKKHKYRLVVDGSKEVVGRDVFDTYAHVIDYSTIRLLISLAFGNGWEMRHWDISVAFTNALAQEVIYSKNMPNDIVPEFKGGDSAILNRNLYGTKSAPKLWYKCLHEFLISVGFKNVGGHPCLFIRVVIVHGEQLIVVIAVFVDDFIVTLLQAIIIKKL